VPSPWSGKAMGEIMALAERELIMWVWGAVLQGQRSGGEAHLKLTRF